MATKKRLIPRFPSQSFGWRSLHFRMLVSDCTLFDRLKVLTKELEKLPAGTNRDKMIARLRVKCEIAQVNFIREKLQRYHRVLIGGKL